MLSVADTLYDAFPEVLECASKEDDSVEIVCQALES